MRRRLSLLAVTVAAAAFSLWWLVSAVNGHTLLPQPLGPESQGGASAADLAQPAADQTAAVAPACDGDAPGTANPAAVYCYELGYEHQIVDAVDGQRGACLFPDGGRCDAWRFLEGRCGQSYSYCASQGYDVITKTDGQNPFSRDYSVCVDDQREIGPVTELMGLSEIADRGPLPAQLGPSPPEEGPPAVGQPPSSFDWRNYDGQNWMTSVKDQNPCGGCWAFSAVGITEAVYNIGWNDPDLDHDLSEQQLISNDSPCCGSCGDCDGGWSDVALGYITDPGIADEACFPFTATTAPCALCPDWTSRVVTIADSGTVPSNQATIKEQLIDRGPLSVYVQILEDGDYWDGDVYKCGLPVQPNHAVVLVGYNDAGGYWIAKNSWGTGYEDNGYYKVGYGQCFVEDYVYYAVPHPKPGDYRLTMQVSPPGSGTTDPSEGDHWYAADTTVDVCASPNPGCDFDHWGGDCSGTSPCTSVYMDSDKTCTANFACECPVYTSTDVPQPINDYTTTYSLINVGDSLTLTDVNAGPLFITHTWDSDLEVFLNSPGATRVELFADVGGAGDNFTDTVLDDECATPITAGSAPFTGCYQPVGFLSDFDGENSAGVWTLEVYDDAGGDSGTLHDWSLVLCGEGGEEYADVKVISQDIYAPSDVAVSEEFYVAVDKVLHNNGPYGPVEAQLNWSVSTPLDCAFTPIEPTSVQVTLPISVEVVIYEDGLIHCLEPSTHIFTWENCIDIKDPGVIDPDPTNNCASTDVYVNVVGEADVHVISQEILGPPSFMEVSEDLGVLVNKAVHNNGPYGDVEAQINWSVSTPLDCTFTPWEPTSVQVTLPVSVDVVIYEDGDIHCLEPGLHTFTWENCIDLKEPHVFDPNPGDNCASTDLYIDVGDGEGADVKVVDFWTEPGVVYAGVSEWVEVTAAELKHNNGPSTATASAAWVIDNPPEVNVRWLAQPGDQCTLNGNPVACDDPGDINDLHFDVDLPVSQTVPVSRDLELHCKQEGDFVLTLSNEEWPIGLEDPNHTNNYLETQLTVHCGGVDTVVRVAGPTRHWTVAEGGQTVVPLDALQVDPGVCTVTVDVDYNDAVVLATDCVADPDGHFGTVLCNTTIPGTVSLTLVEVANPVSGDFPLADITFEGVGSQGEVSPLDVTVHQFADCLGAELPVRDEDGEIEMGLLGDVDCDGDWDAVDAMFILQYVVHLREPAYQCPLPVPDPLPYLDLRGCDTQGDGDCDAVDAMFILQCVVHIPNPFCPG